MKNAGPTSSLSHVPWWLWPTVLCLDAPAVAVAWQGLFARQAGVSLGWHHVVLLALAVWLAYVADRWIEGWRLTEETVRTHRHYFYMRRRWESLAAWSVGLVAGIVIAVKTLTAREWLGSAGLLAVVLLYLLSHQLLHRHHRARVPKEICVAVLIAGGALLYPACLGPRAWEGLSLAFGWLVLLALMNCLLISEWEREVDLSQGQTSLALTLGEGRRVFRILPAVMTLGAAVCAWGDLASARHASLAAALSAAALAVLAWAQPRLGRMPARVLADAALLSPLAVMFWR